jgi:hypothetical protein
MDSLSGTSTLIPLPGFPLHIGHGSLVDKAGFRRFGVSERDLGVDFTSPDRAALVTRLLELCIVDPSRTLPEGFFCELSIGKRIECLLLLAAGGADTALGFPFKCSGCGEEIELEITLGEISALQREADSAEIISVDVGDRRLEFRKPTGRDQELWGEIPFSDERSLAAELISTLIVRREALESIDTGDFGIIEAAIQETDPLVDLSCSVGCGECDELNKYEIDLTETALGMLRRAQNRLVVMIHRIASHYHWSEKEIFDIPHWRREQYLELIGAKKN